MKEFDLEEAKAGKPICTRNGHSARIICWDRFSITHPIVAVYKDDSGTESLPEVYTEDGRVWSGCKDKLDLMMAPIYHESWMNVYRGNDGLVFVDKLFDSEVDAKLHINSHLYYLATVKIRQNE